MSQSFSERHGYRQRDAEITVREDAPEDLRYAVAEIARQAGMSSKSIRGTVCRVLFVAPNQNNWSDPNVWEEVLPGESGERIMRRGGLRGSRRPRRRFCA